MKSTKKKANMKQEIEKLEESEAWEASDEVIQLKAKVPLDKVVPVRLSADHWQRLHKQAAEFGIGPSTLARIWILERLGGKTFDPGLPGAWWLSHASGFTARERDIFKLVSQSYPVKEIAENLHVSETTVKRYLGAMGRKLHQDSEYTADFNSE